MARNREHARAARDRQHAEAREAEIQRLYKEGRAWFFRAILALIAGGLLLLVSWMFTALLVVVAVGCTVQGVRIAMPATRMSESAD